MISKFGHKGWFVFVISILLITDLAILLDIPYIRQILGFLFLIILPGLLILQILKLDKLEFTEKFVLSVGLSVSFLMFFGLLINNLSLYMGYETPLATIPLLISFNIAFVVLAIVGHTINKTQTFSFPSFNLNTSEKAFLTVPILFPALSIFGMHVMNTTGNNVILMFLYLLIPAYVIFVCIFNQKFSKRLYPFVIFLISISLLLMFMLRFSHIYGSDVHCEYYFFRMTLNNLQWGIIEHGLLDACLSISLLPTIFQSIMDVNAQEYFFRGIYVSICSFAPLAIYVISKRYIDELYAFLASFFFLSQPALFEVARTPRTGIAVFFIALAVMVFFNDKIDPLKRRVLFIVFMSSVVVSHYSSGYIFFFIMLFSWFAVEMFSKIYSLDKKITLTIVLILFAFIFFWYSQVTETAFNAGVEYIENTLLNLNNFFVEELRDPGYKQLAGQELKYGMLSKASLAVTWSTFILIGIGVVTMIWRYKEMISIPYIKIKKLDFLKTKFEMEYLTMALACTGIMVSMVILPYVSMNYGIERLYLLGTIILSICLIIGGMTVSKYFKVKPYLIILLILVLYFLFYTNAAHQLFGIPLSIVLNPVEIMHDTTYVHDQESYAAKWLKNCADEKSALHTKLYTTDPGTRRKLVSQAEVSEKSVDYWSFSRHRKIKGYLYLSYNNVVNDRFPTEKGAFNRTEFNRFDYTDVFVGKNGIYDNGGSEVWR